MIQRSRARRATEKAEFHQLTGAGRSHVLRKFFELDRADEAAIVQMIDDGLQRAMKKDD